MVKIAVVGAGAPGMSSALCIKQALPQAHVTVIADKFNKDTTSYSAGGNFRVAYIPHERYRQWVRNSWRFYSSVASGPECKQAGVSFKSGYHLCNQYQPKFEEFLKELPHWHRLDEKELSLFPKKYKCGYFYTSLIIECKYHLSWLMKKFEALGGNYERRKILSFLELADDYDVVVNCAGLSNQWLMDDNTLYPVRGQVFKVKMPWQTHFVYADHVDTYILVGKDNVIVGGHRVSEKGNESLDHNPEHSRLIWKHAVEVLPSLKEAEVEAEWVGLRPQRDSEVRVECDTLTGRGKQVQMVHNYGHGGFGVSLAWGTAQEATELVKQLVGSTAKL